MYRDWKIVAVIPSGRGDYLRLLQAYLYQLRPVLDYVVLWMNTECKRDINYIHTIHASDPEFFRIEYLPDGEEVRGCDSIHHFFRNCTQEGHIYMRFDDDIVYTDGLSRFQKFLDFRIDHPEYLFVFPNIVNNSYVSYYHKQNGVLDYPIEFERKCMGNQWASMDFTEFQHREFLHDAQRGRLDHWYFGKEEVGRGDRFSINSMAWMGDEFKKFGGRIGTFEEWYATVQLPKLQDKDSCIYGEFIVCHYAYFNQRHYLDNCTDILERYGELLHGPSDTPWHDEDPDNPEQVETVIFLKDGSHSSKHGFDYGLRWSFFNDAHIGERIIMFDPKSLEYRHWRGHMSDGSDDIIMKERKHTVRHGEDRYNVTQDTDVKDVDVYNACNLRYPGSSKMHIFLENNPESARYDVLLGDIENRDVAYQWFVQHFHIPYPRSEDHVLTLAESEGVYLMVRAVHHGKLVPVCQVIPDECEKYYRLKFEPFEEGLNLSITGYQFRSGTIHKIYGKFLQGAPPHRVAYYVDHYRVELNSGEDIPGTDKKYPTYTGADPDTRYLLFNTHGMTAEELREVSICSESKSGAHT